MVPKVVKKVRINLHLSSIDETKLEFIVNGELLKLYCHNKN